MCDVRRSATDIWFSLSNHVQHHTAPFFSYSIHNFLLNRIYSLYERLTADNSLFSIAMSLKTVTASALFAATASAKVYFHESFDNMDKWVVPEENSDLGKFELSSGKFNGNAKINQGLRTTEDSKFYRIAAEIAEGFTNKDKDLVVSMQLKHDKDRRCGGAYIKIGPKMDLKKFNGESEYFLMFGPDTCGAHNKVHVIFGGYKTPGNNLEWKRSMEPVEGIRNHVYTLVVRPDLTYELFVDQESKREGILTDEWDFLPPKEINSTKPDDWVDAAEIFDPEDKPPAGWQQPLRIKDVNAKQPEDWDEEVDGVWEAPQIYNPEYKGVWIPRKIPNPAYKGEWEPTLIANPDFEDDKEMYYPKSPMKWVGIDVWQVESGTIFDNIIIGDDLDEVNDIIDETWGATKAGEFAALRAVEIASAQAQAAQEKKKKAKQAPILDEL